MAKVTEPQITKTNKGWRVDLPNGDVCFQPSHDFAVSYVRRWQVADNMAKDHEENLRAQARRRDTTGYVK